MASGNPVVNVVRVMPPGASFAYPTRIAGASTPAESIRVWTFPDTGSTYLDFLCFLKGYGGGGLTLRLMWGAAAATNNAVWQAAVRYISDDAVDLDTTAKTYDYNTVTAAAPSVVGETSYDNITFTNGADMDSWADNTFAIIRILRDPANGSDTLANTAYLYGFQGYES